MTRLRAVWLAGTVAAGLFGGGVALLWASATTAQALVADLSSHLIAITTGFTGTEVVLFGAIEGPGEVAVVVVGPKGRVTARHKERVGGVWMNRHAVTFEQVPSYYSVATSRPLNGLVGAPALVRHEIGVDNLTLGAASPKLAPDQVAPFREALIHEKIEQGLYSEGAGQVVFLGRRLFRTNIFFPANVATGAYSVSVFLARDGDIVSAQTTPLMIGKTGVSADISEFAQRQPVFYGLAAIVGAFLIGGLAGTVFGRL